MPHGNINYHSPSLVKTTLARYGSPIKVDNLCNLLCRVGANKRSYPYNLDDPSFLSNFPVGFKGCFKRSDTGHQTKDNFPMSYVTDKMILNTFYKELRIYCPTYKAKIQILLLSCSFTSRLWLSIIVIFYLCSFLPLWTPAFVAVYIIWLSTFVAFCLCAFMPL